MATIAQYPKGFSGGVSIAGIPVFNSFSTSSGPANNVNSGVYWVDSVYGQDGNPGTYVLPLKTLARALVLTNPYDIVMIKPGHTEKISTATYLTVVDAGIQIVGIGVGDIRPTFTLDTANTSTINVTAAQVSFTNCVFVGNFLSIATLFTLTTAKGFVLNSCEIRDTSSILGFLSVVTTDATDNHADNLTVINNRWFGLSTSATSMVLGASALDRVSIAGNYVNIAVNNNKAALLAHTSKVMTNLEMYGNKVFRLNTDTSTGALLITTSATTNTGMVYDNYAKTAETAAVSLMVTAGSIYGLANNLSVGDADKSGFVHPAIGTH